MAAKSKRKQSAHREERDGEANDPENPNTGVADDFAQRPDSSSGAVEVRGELEVLAFWKS